MKRVFTERELIEELEESHKGDVIILDECRGIGGKSRSAIELGKIIEKYTKTCIDCNKTYSLFSFGSTIIRCKDCQIKYNKKIGKEDEMYKL